MFPVPFRNTKGTLFLSGTRPLERHTGTFSGTLWVFSTEKE
jgi:hypothetical protein